MSAIWYSYSKSATARSPRIESVAPALRAKSTSSPSNSATSTRSSSTDSLMKRMRSSTLNSGCLVELIATATTSRSQNASERRMRSSCPRVIGSKLPAYTAILLMSRHSREWVAPRRRRRCGRT